MLSRRVFAWLARSPCLSAVWHTVGIIDPLERDANPRLLKRYEAVNREGNTP